MSRVRDELAAQLARFDDEAYVALASRGLLRRAQKDLEKTTPAIIEESDDAVTMAVGEQRVRFDAAGPSHAQCTCPASGICQHVLAAAITLQRSSAAPAAEPEAKDEERIETLHAALLGMSAAELVRHAGKAGYRWAWQFAQDLDREDDLTIGGGQHVVIGFAQPRMTFRYMGGGPESLIADVQVRNIEKYRVAAVLAYQLAHGVAIEPPQPTARARTSELGLGKDHATPQAGEAAQHESRARLRASVRELLIDSVELGLSHLSRSIEERYSTFAVWAQGAEYYRLALLLRRIADHVEMLLERAGNADEHRLLDEITFTYGLVTALDEAAERNAAPAHLVGRARSEYEKRRTLEVVGLGASAWRSASGYVGLTMIFWSPEDSSFFSCTDARPEMQRGFDPVARYRTAGPWSGLGAPEQATGRRVVLSSPQVNALGRLSAAESTSALVRPLASPDELARELEAQSRWLDLAKSRTLARRSLLVEPKPMLDWAALRPKQFGRARFDPTRQRLVWPLYDEDGQRLDAELAYSRYTENAIAKIEQLPFDLPEGTLLIAHLRAGAGRLVAEPLSLVYPDAAEGRKPVDALYFDPPREPAPGSARVAGAEDHLPEAHDAQAAAVTLPYALRDLRQVITRQAERGVTANNAEQVLRELLAAAQRTAAAGFTAFSQPGDPCRGPAERLLQANYVGLQYDRLLDDNAHVIA